jgi:DNA-binding SARP family transcriptional activator/tetratricopeptide (TPR) repeat protein
MASSGDGAQNHEVVLKDNVAPTAEGSVQGAGRALNRHGVLIGDSLLAGQVVLRLLGPVEAHGQEGWLAGSPQLRSVMAVLALHADQVVSLGELVDAVWGDSPPRSAQASIQVLITRLRRLLAGLPGAGVERHGGGYRARIQPALVDVHRFRALTRSAAEDGDGLTVMGRLDEALRLWRGPALAGVPDTPKIEAIRAGLALELSAARQDHAAALIGVGREREAARELSAMLAADPLGEQLAAMLMIALYRCGRQSDALQVFRDIRSRLADGLAVEPGPELQRLHQQILAGDPALAVAPGDGAALIVPPPQPQDLPPGGQSCAAAVASSPSGADLSGVPRQLPAAVSHFAGRAGELGQLDGHLQAAGPEEATVMISAIDGTAGVGKTALAVHWAHRVASQFPDGQLYVNLRGYDTAQPVPATDALAGFLRALGISGQDVPPGEDERAARYRSLLAGRRLLVLLDNASSADQVRPLLPGASSCVTVVTSRDSLAGLVATDGARRISLDLLPQRDAVGLLQALIGARAADDPPATAALASHCSRLPLALRVAAELAAFRPTASVSWLAGELADQQRQLDLLDASQDPRSAVRTVFSWSCRHLDSSTARGFRLLALSPCPDFDSYAAAALTGYTAERASDLLDRLSRAHLIHRTGARRFGMHDLLRAYATELAMQFDAEPERQRALTRLLDYYLAAALAAAATLFPAEHGWLPSLRPVTSPLPPLTDQLAAGSWLEAELPSLLAVVSHAAAHGWPSHATGLAAAVFRYLDSRGYYPEAVCVHTLALAAARQAGDRAAEARALTMLGFTENWQSRYRPAAGRLRHAIALTRELGDEHGAARAHHGLGLNAARQGHYERAAAEYQQALQLYRASGDRAGEARALGNLGRIDQRVGMYRRAASRHRRALDLFRAAGDRLGEACTVGNLGEVDWLRGRYQQSAVRMQEALGLLEEIGARTGDAYPRTLTSLGCLDLLQGHYAAAASHHRQALALFRQAGDRTGEAESLNGLGEVLLATGDARLAGYQHAAALSIASDIGDRREKARADDGLGRACHTLGNAEAALRYWQCALAGYAELGAPEAALVRGRLAAIRTARPGG